MGDIPDGAQHSAAAASSSRTETVDKNDKEEDNREPALKLKLKAKEEDKKAVKWTEDTVDNEGLGKKKSKCCCVYVKPPKPRMPGDPASSSDDSDTDDDECKHCPGHHGKDVKQGADNGAGPSSSSSASEH